MSIDMGKNNALARRSYPRRPAERAGKDCPKCGAPLLKRDNARGPFLACSKYPACKYAENPKVACLEADSK